MWFYFFCKKNKSNDTLGLNEAESLFWAEAKKGTSHDIYESIIQLILTLGKERPQDTILPPAFITHTSNNTNRYQSIVLLLYLSVPSFEDT